MISYKLKNWTASDSEKAAIGGFHVMFFFYSNKRRSNFWRQKNGNCQLEELENLLLKQIAKRLKRNNHFLC